MNHAGMTWPFASLRWPVSISWLMSTLISVESPTTLARIFIGSAISASAAAQSDLHFLGCDEVLSIGLDQRVNVRGLRHLDAGRDRRLGAGRKVEHGREHVRILFDQDRDRFGLRKVAGDADRHHRAVFGD